jgi:hypothetical protein
MKMILGVNCLDILVKSLEFRWEIKAGRIDLDTYPFRPPTDPDMLARGSRVSS